MLLHSLMTEIDLRPDIEINEIMRKMINDLPKYSGANIMILIENELWVSTNYNRFPKYFILKYLRESNKIILSSEEIPYFGPDWNDLENHEIISVRNLDNVNRYSENSVVSI